MVDDEITDGKRIAELLASELTGLDRPPLDRIAVVDAAPDATPSPDGTLAYRVALDGDHVGEVVMYPRRVEVALTDAVPRDERDGVDRAAESDDVSPGIDAGPAVDVRVADEGTTVTVGTGAAVKRASDLLAAVVESRS